MTRTASDRRGDGGAAAVDFVLVGTLVTLMFLAVVQLGIDFHVRNVLAACVADGARYGANADVADPEAGARRANQLIERALGAPYARAVAVDSEDDVDGVPVVTVRATVHLPLIAWFLPAGPVAHVTGHAVMEPR